MVHLEKAQDDPSHGGKLSKSLRERERVRVKGFMAQLQPRKESR